jgi:glycosyltransferase involved in cell wall biosynthesis
LRLLFLLTEPPFPPSDGIKIKEYNLIKGLFDKGHEVHVISFSSIGPEREMDGWEKYCSSLTLVPLVSTRLILLKNFARFLLKREIINFRYANAAFEAVLKDFVKKNAIDIVHFDLISLTHYAKSVNKSVPCIASINDSYSLWLKNKMLKLPEIEIRNFLQKGYYTVTFPLAVRYEKSVYKQFKKVHVVSPVDKFYLDMLDDELEVEVIQNGVNTEHFQPLVPQTTENCLIYLATMNGENSSNVIWFIKHVFSHLRRLFPDLELYLVGKNPTRRLIEEADRVEGITITGYVKDVKSYINKATLSIDSSVKTCGILNHVLESMAMSKVVVGTPSSFLAIKGAIPWNNVVISHSKKQFINNIAYLLKNKSERERIGKNARQLIEKNYQWSTTVSLYEKSCYDIIKSQ